MITAVIRHEGVPEVMTFRLTVRGHAKYSRGGDDIVCASVSITVQALARCALEMARRGEAEEADFATYDSDEREVSLRVRAKQGDARAHDNEVKARALFLQAETALTMLTAAYPDHVALLVS